MTEFYFFRHAESELNVQEEIIGGRSNFANLTARGEQQADMLGDWIAASAIVPDVVISSPANRTMQTKERSLARLLLPFEFHVDDRIQELAQGVKEGANRYETYTPEIVDQIAQQQLDFKFEGGESIRDVMYRKAEFFKDTSDRYPDATIFVYGHGLAIRALAGYIDRLSHHDILRTLKTPNVSLTRMSSDSGVHRVHVVGQPVTVSKSV